MNLMKHIVLIIGLTLAALSVQAQSNIVRGTVRDAKRNTDRCKCCSHEQG